MNRFLTHTLVSLILFAQALKADSFSDGVTAYEQGEYEQALNHFDTAVAENETAAARHNMALSYFQLGQPAEAAWHIERGLRLAPLKEEYHYKLGALRQQLSLFENSSSWYTIGAQFLRTKTWIVVTCISFWLLLAACALPAIGGLPVNLGIKTVRGITVILMLLALPALWVNHGLNQSGIVVSDTPTDLHTAPASAAPASGVARPGERARIVDQFKDFYKVKTEAQITGWISTEDFRALAVQ
ncbi:MAG: tetratricopeptide repeat protein [Lentimonas sp.]